MAVGTKIVVTRSKEGSLDIWYEGSLIMSQATEDDLNELIQMLYTR